jgi:PAS domain S-box-containing protein
LLVRELQRSGFAPTCRRVETSAAMSEALRSETWDVIIADYNLPSFSAPAALALARSNGNPVPFIIVSGGIGEEVAVAAVKEGADDYLLKDRLARLGPAVTQALEQRRLRAEKRRADDRLRESEQRFRAIIENSSDGISLVSPDGIILYASPSTTRILGYSLDEFVGRDAFERIHPDDLPHTRALFARLIEQPGATASAQYRYRHKDGSWRWMEGVASNLLAGSSVQAVIVNYRDITERKLAVRRESELRVAGQIQQRLFPAVMPQLAGLEIGGISYPADDTGGDYFDFLTLRDQRIGLVVGDVSGHGYGAALLMASTRAYLRAFAQTHTDIGQILTLTNRLVSADTGDHFVTVVLATVDTAARTLCYASAGHAEGYILDAAGALKAKLDSTGFPLGILAKSEYSSSSPTALEAGDLVLLLTDGIVEAHDPDLVDFGTDRVLQTVRSCRHEPARQIAEHLCAAARSFAQPLPQDDDITAVVLKVGPPP